MPRSARSAASALLVLAVLDGCAPQTACPAVGWFNTIEVTVAGDTSLVDDVQFCDAEQCSGPPGVLEDGTTVVTPWGSMPVGEDRWDITLGMESPQTGDVRVLAADGTALMELGGVPLDWVRVGGTEECGGPGVARVTVDLDGPSTFTLDE